MTTRSSLRVGLASLLAVVGACKADSVGPRPAAGACTDTTSVATDLTLSPGQVAVLSGSAQTTCVRVPATAAAADYVFVVTDVDTKLDVEQGYTLDARQLTGSAAAMTARGVEVAAAPTVDVTANPYALNAREAAIRGYERAHFRGGSPLLAAAQSGRTSTTSGALGVRGSVASASVVAGDTLVLRVPSLDPNKDACANYDSVKAVVKYVGQASLVVQDANAPLNGFTLTDFQAISNEFDQKIFATDTSYFGSASDIDFNGKVVLLFTPLINKATPKNSQSFFAGFFFAGDLFPRTGSQAGTFCKESNVGELFYLLVPDPTGAFSDPRSTSTVREITRGTVAHEFQHMINAGVRFPNPNANFEEVWLDEALSHLAEEAVGRDERGFGDLQPLGYNDVAAVTADYKAFFQQNLVRFGEWLPHPDTSAGPSAHADQNLSSRGAAWALLRYSLDQYSGGNVRALTKRLVAGPETGIANLAARTGVPYSTIIPNYMVANYADDLGIAGLPSLYTYPSWLMRDAVGRANGGSYPLRVTSLSSTGSTTTGKVRSGSAAYFRYAPAGASPAMAVRLLSSDGVSAATWTGARLVVLRVK